MARPTTVAIFISMFFAVFSVYPINGYAQSELQPCPSNQTQRYDNCFGTYAFPGDEVYIGEWKDNKMNGKGTLTFPSGEKYVGEFKDGKRNGKGTHTFGDGRTYAGEFKEDKFNGQGTFTFPDTAKYVGEFKDGKRNGQGTLTLSSGATYVGEWRNGKESGQGTLTLPDGEKYVGEFRDGNYSGTGTLYAANGFIIASGTWDNNELVAVDSGVCDEWYLRANAIFIRATLHCTKNYMDSSAGYFVLEKARACQSIGEAALQSKAIEAMTELDGEAIKRGNTAVCQWVDEIENSVNEAAAAEGWPSAPADVTQPETLGEVRGWTITYDGSGDGACYSSAEYRSGTTLTVGKLGPNASWSIQLVNPKWSSIVVGSQYDTSYVFNGRNTWTGADTGIENGIRSEGLTEDFIAAFARSSSLELRLKEKRVDGFDLTGTRAASDAVAQCYKDRVETADPFASTSSDPFANGPSASMSASIEGRWGFEKTDCETQIGNDFTITQKNILGLEWSCDILDGTYSENKWIVKAQCSESGGYEYNPIPISNLNVELFGNGSLALSGDEPLSYGDTKPWKMVSEHFCGPTSQ